MLVRTEGVQQEPDVAGAEHGHRGVEQGAVLAGSVGVLFQSGLDLSEGVIFLVPASVDHGQVPMGDPGDGRAWAGG